MTNYLFLISWLILFIYLFFYYYLKKFIYNMVDTDYL